MRYVDAVDRWAERRVERAQPSQQDILSEERERRSRSRSQGRRLWWPGNWLRNRLVGVVVLCSFLGAGLLVLVLVNPVSDSRVVPGVGPGAGDLVGDSGRDLTAGEISAASVFGNPYYLGDEGLPVVRHHATGEIRELTPVEMEFDSHLPYVAADDQSHYFSPGPRGWGIWWTNNSVLEAYGHHVRLTRGRWRERQEVELRNAVDRASEGLEVVASVNLERWETGWADSLSAIVSPVRARYEVMAFHDNWSALPDQWLCDIALERDMRYGLTEGCPTQDYLSSLSTSWSRVGHLLDIMEDLAETGRIMDNLSYSEQRDGFLVRPFVDRMAYLFTVQKDTSRSLDHLFFLSMDESLPISAEMFRYRAE